MKLFILISKGSLQTSIESFYQSLPRFHYYMNLHRRG
jgi:hypothetical protein